jgi:hypothetical protein
LKEGTNEGRNGRKELKDLKVGRGEGIVGREEVKEVRKGSMMMYCRRTSSNHTSFTQCVTDSVSRELCKKYHTPHSPHVYSKHTHTHTQAHTRTTHQHTHAHTANKN